MEEKEEIPYAETVTLAEHIRNTEFAHTLITVAVGVMVEAHMSVTEMIGELEAAKFAVMQTMYGEFAEQCRGGDGDVD